MAVPIRLKTSPPRLLPLSGRASPKGSLSPRGIGAGIDRPNTNTTPVQSSLGTPVRNFCKGGKVISTKAM